MGKGNRSRNNRYDEAYEMSSSGTAVKTGAKKDNTSTILMIVIAAVLLAAILLWTVSGIGVVGRNDIVLRSENYKVDANMMTYYQNVAYMNQYYQNYYLALYYFSGGDDATAHAYAQQAMSQYSLKSFFGSALTTAKEILVLCEDAKAAGVALDQTELDAIEAELDGVDSFSASFGSGVSKKDVRKAAELYYLAQKYAEIKNEELEAAVTDEEIQKYIEENKGDFYKTEYLAYEFSLKATDFTDDAEGFEAAKKLADECVLALTAAKTTEEFKTILVNYIADRDFQTLFDKNLGEATAPEQGVLDAALALIKDALIKEFVNEEDSVEFKPDTYTAVFSAVHKALKTTIQSAVASASASYTEITDDTKDYMKWLISENTNALDTKSFDESTESVYTKTVYMIVSPNGLDEGETREVAHLLVAADKETAKEEEINDAKKKAEELLAEFKAGDKTLASFKEIAKKNTADSGVVYTFGRDEMVEEFEDWAFDAARTAGETGIVQTTHGFHIMYFVRVGDAAYKEAAKDSIRDEKYDDYIEKASADLTVNQRIVDKYGK